jgi:5-methylcytosine-specific restriction endonuclease McrA
MNCRRRQAARRALARRDGWGCWLCGEAIDPDAPVGSDRAAGLVRVVPRVFGGTGRLENLRLVHRDCGAREHRVSRPRPARLNSVRKRALRRAIVERDGWSCWLCGGRIDPDAPAGSDWALSLDHVIPLFCGGAHSSDNLRPAHRACTALRGFRWPGEAAAGKLAGEERAA